MFKSTDTLPASQDQFFWADFVEFQAIISPDRCFSLSELIGSIKRNTDSNRKIENAELAWNDLTNFVCTRIIEFGHAYPFKLTDEYKTVYLDYKNTPQQDFYLFLLIASSMRFISSQKQHEVARVFEETCFTVFRHILPSGSEVKATWAGGGNAAIYTGTLFEKMKAVADDIRCTANFDRDDFKATDTGDGGIDIIAWHPMEDNRQGIPIAFAQCGCSTTDWTFKQLEASPAAHLHHLPVIHPWATYYFLPLDLRRPDGDWGCKSKIKQAIVVDRLRMARLADRYELYQHLPQFPFIAEALNYKP